MKFTRDGAIWTVTFVTSVIGFLLTQLDTLHAAFGLAPVWDDRLKFVFGLLGMIAGLLKMSPLALSTSNPMAGTSAPEKTLNVLKPGNKQMPEPPPEPSKP